MGNLHGVYRFKDDLTYPYDFTVLGHPQLFILNLNVPLFYYKVADRYEACYGIEASLNVESRKPFVIYYYTQDGDKDIVYSPDIYGDAFNGWLGDIFRTIYVPNNIEVNDELSTWFSQCLELKQTYPSIIEYYYEPIDSIPHYYKTIYSNTIELSPINNKIPELSGTEYKNYVVIRWYYYGTYREPINGETIFENTKLVAVILGDSSLPLNEMRQGYVGNVIGWGVNRNRLEILINRFFSGNFGDIISGLNLSDLILGAHIFPFTIDVQTNVACEHVNPITSALTTIWEPDGYCGVIRNSEGSLKLGKIYPKRFYNDFRDFLNDVYIYLPYLGYVKIPCDIFYRYTVWQLRIDVDLFSGKGSYYIEHEGDEYGFWSVQIGLDIPIIKTDYNNSLRGALSNAVAAIAYFAMENYGGAAVESVEAVDKIIRAPNIGVKSSVGDFSQSGMTSQPFIRYCRTVTNNIDNIEYYGRVCKQNVSLRMLRGYAEINDIHLENINATQEELDEIVSLLKSGVIF